ncbi:MAG: Uma2 family endonuclease [Chloroflexi bacterium]|nr:Uma2 family endonuclease [Chloroflexota bacterium]
MAVRVEASTSLEAGDHLTREEFHRRYLARPDIKKAELIDGVVYVPSPVRIAQHGEPHGFIMGWLALYVSQSPGVRFGDNVTVYLDAKVEVQPDAILFRPGFGGPRETEDGYLEGAPQLVVEVAASSATYDLHVKKEAYRRNGVREYVVWRVLNEAIDWFRLQGGEYVLVEPDADGIIESEQFPGLHLHVPSMLSGDLAAVLARLRGAGA